MIDDINLLTIFTTGLLTGGLTCVAVQGGLLTSALSQNKKLIGVKLDSSKIIPVIAFIISKLFVYTILGLLLGFVGSLVQFSLNVRIVIQFLVVVFMLGTALNLLNIHPFFEKFTITPPRSLMNFAYKKSDQKDMFSAILLGLFTVFIPCGATQAMMALAVISGNPFYGGIIMFAFVLGTSPVFFLLGLATVSLRSKFNKAFTKIAAIFIIILALFNLDASLALSNSPFTIRSTIRGAYCVFSYCDFSFVGNPVNEQTITFTSTGYFPNHFAVRKGEKITLHLVNQNATGCIQSFTISALNIQKIVLPNQTADLTFTAPAKTGRITFTCSQGLYPGIIEVI